MKINCRSAPPRASVPTKKQIFIAAQKLIRDLWKRTAVPFPSRTRGGRPQSNHAIFPARTLGRFLTLLPTFASSVKCPTPTRSQPLLKNVRPFLQAKYRTPNRSREEAPKLWSLLPGGRWPTPPKQLLETLPKRRWDSRKC